MLAGPTSVVALDPNADDQDSLTSELWEAVNTELAMGDLVSRLVRIESTRLPRLAVLIFENVGIRALLRGDVRILSEDGDTVAHGADVLTWLEVRLADLSRIELDLGGPEDQQGALPVVRGAVRAGRLRLSALDAAPPSTPPETSALPAPQQPPPERRGPESRGPQLPPPPDLPDPDPAPDPAPDPTGSGAMDDTQLEPPHEPYGADDELHDELNDELDDELIDEMDDTQDQTFPPIAPAPSSRDVEAMENADTAMIYLPPLALARLRAPDGSTVDLDRPVLIGRAPSDSGFENAQPHLLTVPSPSQDISRTHLLVAPEGGAIVVTDLHSTNGTTVVKPGPGIERVALPSGQPVSVEVGSVLELGDEVAILIDEAH